MAELNEPAPANIGLNTFAENLVPTSINWSEPVTGNQDLSSSSSGPSDSGLPSRSAPRSAPRSECNPGCRRIVSIPATDHVKSCKNKGRGRCTCKGTKYVKVICNKHPKEETEIYFSNFFGVSVGVIRSLTAPEIISRYEKKREAALEIIDHSINKSRESEMNAINISTNAIEQCANIDAKSRTDAAQAIANSNLRITSLALKSNEHRRELDLFLQDMSEYCDMFGPEKDDEYFKYEEERQKHYGVNFSYDPLKKVLSNSIEHEKGPE